MENKKNDISMFFIGDIHRDFNYLIEIVRKYEIQDQSFFQVGDFGVGFPYKITSKERGEYTTFDAEEIFKHDLKELRIINKIYKKYNNHLYVIRGNHDNPSYWNQLNPNNKKLKSSLSNIHFVKDFSVININDHKILCVGGGISIDRSIRERNISHWEDEKINYNLILNINKMVSGIDIVITHVPLMNIFGYLSDIQLLNNYYRQDSTLKSDLETEINYLDVLNTELTKQNKITHWISGHLHKSDRTIIDDTSYTILDINEVYQIHETR